VERLDTIESTKYEKVSREFIEEVEQDGVVYEKYRQLVTKNDGELQGYCEVLVPKDFDAVLQLPEEEQQELLDNMKVQLITKSANRYRTQVLVSEEEKEEKLQSKLDELKEMGVPEEKIMDLLG